MKITIFGSTGKTGILLVKQALAEGHEIVAFTRNPQKIQFTDSKLSVFEGNSLDAPAVTEAINSSDAVISLIGVNPKSEEFTFYKSMNNIVEAMRKNSVKRLIFSAGAGVGDPLDKGGFLGKLMTGIIKLVARNAYEDGLKTADYIRQQEDIDWSMIRVPMLTDKPGGLNQIRIGYLGVGTGSNISREDMASFMLKELKANAYLQKSPVISN